MPDTLIELVPIAAGRFLMGSPPSESGRYEQEGPQTQVTLTRPFWLGRYGVTVGQWKQVMGTGLREQARAVLADETLYDFYAGLRMNLRDFYQKQKDDDPALILTNLDDDLPMHFVNWLEAAEFCRRLNEREKDRLPVGYEYRFPTDAEREYACRAGTTTATYGPVLDEIGWHGGNSASGFTGKSWDTGLWPSQYIPRVVAGPRRVGTKRPNAWGLYDMLGNVYEPCQDWYADRLPGGSVVDPTGPCSGVKRICRGGAWGSLARLLRSAYRDGDEPTRRSMFMGFRVALAPVLG